jgi:two-component system NtrC family sensor kinase
MYQRNLQTNRTGTELGLSLAYDVIKAHSGEIKVETKEGEGSEFIIQLPVV